MAFDDDMDLIQEPEIRYFVELRIPGGTGNWIRSTSSFPERRMAEEAIGRMSQLKHDIEPERRVAAQVVLNFATTDDTGHRLTAEWDGTILAHHPKHRQFVIPLNSPQVGDIDLEITHELLDRLIESTNDLRHADSESDCND